VEKQTIFDQIFLDSNSSKPIYQQIAEQIQLYIVTEQISSGEHLPSVRYLASILNVNPNTVARAYLELEQKQLVIAKRGGGTIVTSTMDDPAMRAVRQKHLLDTINDHIIKMLGQGYMPEELEATFYTLIDRWREERRALKRTPDILADEIRHDNVIRIAASHDIAFNILVTIHRQRSSDIDIEVTDMGSIGGLIALGEGKADIAGAHLLDEETGEYNVPFIKRVLPGREIELVNLVYRMQGLMVTPGNPKKIKSLEDLRRPDIAFVNRQQGSGTRVLLDVQLKKLGMLPGEIKGYEVELNSHLSVGTAVAQGKADVSLGAEAAARTCKVDFLPLFRERYDLAISEKIYRSERLTLLLEIIRSDGFKNIVNKIDGYNTSQTGKTILVR